MRNESFLPYFILLCSILLAVIAAKAKETPETAPKAVVSPRVMDVTETWDEFDNGEETTIHLEEK